jgi:molybdopterin-guanine dinucleotide biosynthesis protein A
VHEIAVVLLAGGEARRFPRKLEHAIAGRPLVTRTYETVRATGWPVFIAGKGSFSRETDASLDAPMLLDRRPGRGPLRALLSACTQTRALTIFAVAADQPALEPNVLRKIAAARRPNDEAVIPEHDGAIEPLAALYERCALLRAGFELRANPRAGMRDAIARLATRLVPVDAAYFHNVNRPQDLARWRRSET